jgi:hypothetical protein
MTAWVIMLTVVLVTPEGQQDLSSSRQVKTIEECLAAAKDWMDQDAQKLGGIGLAVGCQRVEAPGENG